MVSRGKFIVFEGCDRSGKTTQCYMVVEALKKKNLLDEYIKFPERTTDIVCIINDYLSKKLTLTDQQIHFLFALNRKEMMSRMEEKLKVGVHLIVDRYSFSGIAYSSVKKNMPFEFCCLTEVGLLKPDLVLLLDGSIGTHMERKDFGSEVYEKEHIQLKVKEAYKKHFLHEMEVVDEEGSMEEVHPRMMVCLEKHQVFDAATQPLQYMQSPSFNLRRCCEEMERMVVSTMQKCMSLVQRDKEGGLQQVVELLKHVQC